MTKKLTKNKHLPERVYQKHGAFYYVTRQNKWIRLGKSFVEAMGEWARIVEPVRQCNTMNDLFDKYMMEVATKKAIASYESNVHQIRPLRLAFGEMFPSHDPQLAFVFVPQVPAFSPVAINSRPRSV